MMNLPASKTIYYQVGLLLILIAAGGCRKEIFQPTRTARPSVALESTKIPEIELPFKTISRIDISDYKDKAPGLVVASQRDEINRLEKLFSPISRVELSSVDLQEYLIMAAFQGRQPTTGFDIEIHNVTRVGATEVRLYTHFSKPDVPQHGVVEIVTSPYHLLRIPRDGLQGEITFVLYDDGVELIRETHIIAAPPNEVILPNIYSSSGAMATP